MTGGRDFKSPLGNAHHPRRAPHRRRQECLSDRSFRESQGGEPLLTVNQVDSRGRTFWPWLLFSCLPMPVHHDNTEHVPTLVRGVVVTSSDSRKEAADDSGKLSHPVGVMAR